MVRGCDVIVVTGVGDTNKPAHRRDAEPEESNSKFKVHNSKSLPKLCPAFCILNFDLCIAFSPRLRCELLLYGSSAARA
jgi:hypothetical protein